MPVSLDLARSDVGGRDGSLLRSRFLDVTQRSPNVLGERCVTSKKTAARETRGTGEGTGRARERFEFYFVDKLKNSV